MAAARRIAWQIGISGYLAHQAWAHKASAPQTG
jgi:hypothetical protein